MSTVRPTSIGTIQFRFNSGKEYDTLSLSGRLDWESVPALWIQLPAMRTKLTAPTLKVDMAQVEFCDGAGMALLLAIENELKKRKASVEFLNLSQDLQNFKDRFDRARLDSVLNIVHRKTNAITEIGKFTVDIIDDLHEEITFFGHFLSSAVWTLFHPRHIRWNDFMKLLDLVGVNAIGITLLLGFLFGLIMAFSSAMPLRQFGVEIYVSDLVAVALVRVLGPFITAIIVAGRTGSAFAAELGTMKINNELDALNVMSLEPMRFLVVPRVTSAILMTPLLAILANTAGLIGSGMVITSLGYGVSTYYEHVQSTLTITQILIGLIKSLVFGALVGGVGCLRGLQTESGAGAVGISTTRAVVSGIVLIVVAEGIFSVLLYIMDI